MIESMKNLIALLLVGCPLLVARTTTHAASGGAEFPEEATISGSLVVGAETGISYEDANRGLRIGGETEVIESRLVLVYAAIDIVRRIHLYGAVGQSEIKPETGEPYAKAESVFGAGVKLGLINFELRDDEIHAANLRIGVTAQYSETKSEFPGAELEWDEWRGTVLVGYELIRYPTLRHAGGRHITTLYGGLVYSSINGSAGLGGSLDVEAVERIGWTAGIDSRWNEQIVLGAGIVMFDEKTVVASIGYHF